MSQNRLPVSKEQRNADVTLPDRQVIRPRASMAPAKTVRRLYRMAMIAAMKKVLSPSSETMMTEIAATNAWINPRLPLLGSSGLMTGAAGWPVGAFCTET